VRPAAFWLCVAVAVVALGIILVIVTVSKLIARTDIATTGVLVQAGAASLTAFLTVLLAIAAALSWSTLSQQLAVQRETYFVTQRPRVHAVAVTVGRSPLGNAKAALTLHLRNRGPTAAVNVRATIAVTIWRGGKAIVANVKLVPIVSGTSVVTRVEPDLFGLTTPVPFELAGWVPSPGDQVAVDPIITFNEELRPEGPMQTAAGGYLEGTVLEDPYATVIRPRAIPTFSLAGAGP
jgi:hypothetical protein